MTPDENKIITELVDHYDMVDPATVAVIAMDTLDKYKAMLRENKNREVRSGEY